MFVSGQVGIDADGVLAEGIAAQTERAIGNVNAVLAEAGLGPEDLVKLTIYLTDPANAEGFITAAGPALPSTPPATTMLFVGMAAPEVLVEIDATRRTPAGYAFCAAGVRVEVRNRLITTLHDSRVV